MCTSVPKMAGKRNYSSSRYHQPSFSKRLMSILTCSGVVGNSGSGESREFIPSSSNWKGELSQVNQIAQRSCQIDLKSSRCQEDPSCDAIQDHNSMYTWGWRAESWFRSTDRYGRSFADAAAQTWFSRLLDQRCTSMADR